MANESIGSEPVLLKKITRYDLVSVVAVEFEVVIFEMALYLSVI